MSGEFEAVADIATGALAARAVDRAGDDGHGHDSHGGACLNCGTALVGPHCHQCGQSGHVHRTASALFHDIAHGVFHFEGRTWHTLPMLFAHPGELTRRYVHGERVSFVSPMALFLFSVFLMVATFSWVGGPTGHSNSSTREAAVASTDPRVVLARETAKLDKLKAQRAALPAKQGAIGAAIDKQIQEMTSEVETIRLAANAQKVVTGEGEFDPEKMNITTRIPEVDSVIRKATRNPALTLYKLQSSAYKYSWALIPISLPFIWLMFAFRRDVGLYDHAIFATYSLSTMTLLVVVLSIAATIGVSQSIVWLVFFFFPPWHMYRQLKGAYLLTRGGALWRTFFLIIAAYASALIFVTVLLALELSH
jgi:hypothetical protein